MWTTGYLPLVAGVILATTVGVLPARPPAPGAGQNGTVPQLDVTVAVHDVAGSGAVSFPTSVVIPLPHGSYTDTTTLGIAGAPSQVEAIERWGDDNSLRHVLVHFLADAPANATAIYRFADGGQLAPDEPVTVLDGGAAITITTGPLQLLIAPHAFNLFDGVWLDLDENREYTADERIVASDPTHGGVLTPRAGAGPPQYDSARTDTTVMIEERGPVRAVVRVEAPARFSTTTDHQHGFAVRIYAYAGQPFVKVDYQLTNSDKEVVRAWPLYFEAMDLRLRPNLNGVTSVAFGLGDGSVARSANHGGAQLAQTMHDTFRVTDISASTTTVYTRTHFTGPDGYVDVRDSRWGVMGFIRNIWQTWPNGLAVDPENTVSLQLWPAWSAQWFDKQLSPSGLYWLEDMQHNVKETAFYFHPAATADAAQIGLARTLQFPPVAVLPAAWYAETQATLDLGGVVPLSALPAPVDKPRPEYGAGSWHEEYWFDSQGDYYGAGWVNFGEPEPGYRSVACQHGGWPYTGAAFIATGAPGDYFDAEAAAQGEINLRPEWLAGYSHADDWPRLQLTENPYCGGRWRIFEGHGVSKLAAPPLPDTGAADESPVQYARDDQHGWFYHVADAYWLTGSLWLRDWYEFAGQFRRVMLARLDPFPDTSSRAVGHGLSHALQAYRITGDRALLDAIAAHVRDYLRRDQDPGYGDQLAAVEESGGGFQTGYLMRAIVGYLEEARAVGDWQAYAEGFNYLSGLMAWNLEYGNFPYYFDARQGGAGQSDGSGLTLVDPQAWYYWHTGKPAYWNQILDYMDGGINGGDPPYGDYTTWQGQFEGRYYLYVAETSRPDMAPPQPIADLQAWHEGSQVRLRWTAPADAVRYHVVWSDRPLTEAHTLDANLRNWWAAQPIGPALTPQPGTQQTLLVDTHSAATVYAAIFTFDAVDNMSDMSNVALAAATPPPPLHPAFLPLIDR